MTFVHTKIVSVKTRFKTMIMKVPGRTFISAMARKVKTFVGSHLFKKRAKKGIITRVVKGLARLLAKFLGKILGKVLIGAAGFIASLGSSLASLVITYGWLMYDIYSLYSAIKNFFMLVAYELGYDVTRPAWFAIFLWEQKREIMKYAIDNFDEFFAAIRDGIKNAIWGFSNQVVLYLIADDKRRELWQRRWAIFNNYSGKTFKTITDSRNFLEKQRTRYAMIVKTAVRIKKIDEELAAMNEKFGCVDNEEQLSIDY